VIEPVAEEVLVDDADAMRELGERVGARCRAGDVIVLSGPLGAGKTTFTQGVAAGLQVSGEVTSPTFVISRVHRSLIGGPDLVHVDAYRLSGLGELDDLDLDASLGDSVTVVEWGTGLAELLGPRPVRVTIDRDLATTVEDPRETRRVTIIWPDRRS
jgi:tRNA threonylcarbamoyladenosine biosynthesis protein TsaE